ncbi:hypothetical protein SEMRO_1879_G303140.1 [Seminavis robusta]|uniref:Uncharacterized protein n=1 Tax=Seminavis robusta TaxID=568900 RepID=A0A9N8HTG8_9STRA|nr:hypothetical protein SEMRO_1879_G303140.1 [Seminavis robusta]|eukprot:Sro1879_g303140.1 n/a (279) ;mRNA; f:1058-2012
MESGHAPAAMTDLPTTASNNRSRNPTTTSTQNPESDSDSAATGDNICNHEITSATENTSDRKMTPEERAHAEEILRLTENTQLQERDSKDSPKPMTKDSKEVDDRKPATKESRQVQKDGKSQHDNSKGNDTINMDSASRALATILARFNNPQQSGQLAFLPKEMQSQIKRDPAEKIAVDNKMSANPNSKETRHNSSTFAALSSVEVRLNNPGLSFLPPKSSGQHRSGIVPPTEQGQNLATFPTIETNAACYFVLPLMMLPLMPHILNLHQQAKHLLLL